MIVRAKAALENIISRAVSAKEGFIKISLRGPGLHLFLSVATEVLCKRILLE
jgi:hypothetical protein